MIVFHDLQEKNRERERERKRTKVVYFVALDSIESLVQHLPTPSCPKKSDKIIPVVEGTPPCDKKLG